MKVGLIVDNPRRDLLGLSLLASELVKLGRKVLLIPMNLAFYEIPFHIPDYLLLPGFRKTSLPVYQERYNLGINLGVMETEGAFYLDSAHRLQILEDSPKVNDIISHYFVWGNSYKEILLQTKSIEEAKVNVVGNPKMDIMQVMPLQAEKKDSLLLCSNFTMVKGDKLNEGMINSFEQRGIKNAMNYYYGLDLMKSEFIEFAKVLAKRTDVKVIFRPHPFEDVAYYKEAFVNTGIEIDESANAIKSIDRSFVTIQNSSTTGVEAVLRKVPTIIPDYIENGYKIKTIRDVSYLANSREELMELINRSIEGKLDSKNKSDELNEVVYLHNNQNSSALIAKKIAECEPRNKVPTQKVSLRYSLKKQLKAIAKLPIEQKSFKQYVLGNRMDEWDKSYKYFNMEDVKKQLEQLEITSCAPQIVKNSRSILIDAKVKE